MHPASSDKALVFVSNKTSSVFNSNKISTFGRNHVAGEKLKKTTLHSITVIAYAMQIAKQWRSDVFFGKTKLTNHVFAMPFIPAILDF